jgi:hypothetical protein
MKITGGDGSSIENAIIISECSNLEGIDQEYSEVRKRFGNYTLIRQILLNIENKKYDKLELDIEGGKIEEFFDITDFYGKGFEF